MQRYEFDLFADYHQFYLQDEEADPDISAESWSEQALENGAVLMLGKIFVQTARDMDVPVVIEVQELAPDANFEEWDKVFECSIAAPSGKIVVAGCTDEWSEAERIQVTPGTYRARIYYGDLDALSEDGLDGDDHYKVALWPAPEAEAKRLK